MLKIFNDKGICQQIIAVGNFDLARQQAEREGNTAFESNSDAHEVLVDGVLHEVKSPWIDDVIITGYKLIDNVYHYTYTEQDITDENKAKEAEILSLQEADKREKRNALLAETDFYALSDVTMPDAMKTYRQALRDLPMHKDWPNVDFPTKPEE
jgi:hypothetical protein